MMTTMKRIMMTSKRRKRKDIEAEFLDTSDVVLKVGLADAVITNQKLMLEVLLDIRDSLQKVNALKNQ